VARQLGQRAIAFICARESLGDDRLGPDLKAAFGGVYIANEKFTKDTAQQALDAGDADAVAWGQLFIANPDLPARFAIDAPLNRPNPETYYGTGPVGYVDYPALNAA
jgi:2,4-dienoyl-CoA reductase-like NADH-dependent reductase (Old Yellow Enzyme family)